MLTRATELMRIDCLRELSYSGRSLADSSTSVTRPTTHEREDSPEGVSCVFTPSSPVQRPLSPTASTFIPGGSQEPMPSFGNTSTANFGGRPYAFPSCTGLGSIACADPDAPPPSSIMPTASTSTTTHGLPYLGLPQSGIPAKFPAITGDYGAYGMTNSRLRSPASVCEDLDKVIAENATLRSMHDEDHKAIMELKEAFTMATEAGKKDEPKSFNEGKLVSDDVKLKIDGVSEMQKMQGTSISAVAGQVGLLDKVMQARVDALSKEIESLKTTSADQVKANKDLEAALEASDRKVAALQQEKDDMQNSLTTKMRDLQSELKTTARDISMTLQRKINELGFELTEVKSMPALNATFGRIQSSVEGIEERLNNVRVRLCDQGPSVTFEAAIRDLASNCANAAVAAQTIDKKEFKKVKTDVKRLQDTLDVNLKRLTRNELEQYDTAEMVRVDISDLRKRANEAVAMADSGAAALDVKLNELKEELATAKNGKGSGLAPSASDFVDLDRMVRAKIKKLEASLEGLTNRVDEADKATYREGIFAETKFRTLQDGLAALQADKDQKAASTHSTSCIQAEHSEQKASLSEIKAKVSRLISTVNDLKELTKTLAINAAGTEKNVFANANKISAVEKQIADGLDTVSNELTCKELELKQSIEGYREAFLDVKKEQNDEIADLVVRIEKQTGSTLPGTKSLPELGDQLSALTVRMNYLDKVVKLRAFGNGSTSSSAGQTSNDGDGPRAEPQQQPRPAKAFVAGAPKSDYKPPGARAGAARGIGGHPPDAFGSW